MLKRYLARVLPLLTLCCSSAALLATWSADAGAADHSLRAGVWAFQFAGNIGGRRGDFGGIDVSAKTHFTEASALRMTVSFYRRSSDGGFQEADSRGFGLIAQGEFEQSDLGLEFQYLYYPHPRPGVNFFLGAGPFVRWSQNEDTRIAFASDSSGEDYLERRRGEQQSLSTGGLVEVGFEWFFSPRLSLIASQGLQASHSTSEETLYYLREASDPANNSSWVRGNESSSFSVSATAAGIGFSVYF